MLQNDNLHNAEGTIESTKVEDQNTTNTDDALLTEINNSNAEEAEDNSIKERHDIEVKDYESFSLKQLTEELESLISSEKIQAIKEHVNAIKADFDIKFNALLEEKKAEFIEQGGNEIDFHYSIPEKKGFNEAYRNYRNKIAAHYKDLEQNLKNNLKTRQDIIDAIKTVTDSEDNMGTKYKQFKELQDAWRNAGAIPKDKYNNAWNSYHFNVERFYDLFHLDRDLRDRDFAANLEKKTKLVIRAEELGKQEDALNAFRELQNLHKLWKEDIGPVSKEHRDAIWDRFKDASKVINDKRQDYFKTLDEKYLKNLEKKEAIIATIATKASETANSHKSWQDKIKEVEVLRDAFFKAGKVPSKVNEQTWAKFKATVREFNRQKNNFYKALKNEQLTNLERKLNLIQVANENKLSDDFEATTPLMKRIQNEWKNIGHVPRKDSDKVWGQFKAACNEYFDRIKEERNKSSQEEENAYNTKAELLEKVKNTDLTGDNKADLKTIKDFISQWKNIGRVPNKKRKIEGDFNKTLDKLFGTLDMNRSESEMIKFDNKLNELAEANDPRLLDSEHNFIRKNIDEVRSEIIQLENNLQFFSNADKSNPLVKDVYKNIEKHQEELVIWKDKLKKLKAFRVALETPEPTENIEETTTEE